MHTDSIGRAVLTVILGIGFFLRVHDLGRQSFWIDEAYTWGVVVNTTWQSVWGAMLAVSDVSPLPYVIAKLTAPLFGVTEFGLRLSSALFGWLAIAVVFRLGRCLLGRRAGVLAAGFIALSPFAVWYAQDARPYGLYLFLGALTLWGFFRAERVLVAWRFGALAPDVTFGPLRGEGWGWAMWVIASAALYLTHYAAALFVYAQAAYLVTRLRRQPFLFRRWAVAQSIAVLPVAAWVTAFLLRRQSLTANTWIPRVTPLTVLQTCWNFVSGDAAQPSAAMVIGLTVLLGLMALGVRRHWQTRPHETQLLLWWLGLPLASAWLLSLRLPAYIDRFFEPALLSVALLLSAGLLALPRPWRWAMTGLITLGLLAASLRLFVDPMYTKEDWRTIGAQVRGGDLPVGVMDAESLLGVTPYLSAKVQFEFARTEDELSERLSEGKFMLILRSPHESAHALAEAGPFDPLTEAPAAVRGWLAAHPSAVLEIKNYSGVSLLVIGR